MDLKKYIYSHCVSPVRTKVWDSYSQSFIYRELPCGKCLHCRNTHINEWCTRLIAQRKYSKYCYYVSLDYAPFTLSDPTSRSLAAETAAVYHNINKFGKYGMHPLVLCKNHLQDFYKRLRKLGVKCQYFACGEYGTHANGRGFGRPHFHNIIFSNFPISQDTFDKAWTVNNYKIGRVDFVDMSNLALGDTNSLKIYKYVCKYLQKADFDFEKLATIDFHRTYFKSLGMVIKEKQTLFGSDTFHFKEQTEFDWKQYIKLYSPFIVCSRRPSIGSAYLEENLVRFKKQDFRLFGLPQECVAFPRYYVRRTKESLCSFRCLGEITKEPSSMARMGYIFKILDQLYSSRFSLENWCENASKSWCYYKKAGECPYIMINDKDKIKCSDLSFYESNNKFLYQFDGYGYKVWSKLKNSTFVQFDYMDIYEVIKEFKPSWDRYYHEFIIPLHDRNVLQEHDLYQSIFSNFKSDSLKTSYDLFIKEVYARYRVELDSLRKKNYLMQNSKQNF